MLFGEWSTGNMRRQNSQISRSIIKLQPDAASIKRVIAQLKSIPKKIGEKILKSASRKWGRETVKLLRNLTPRAKGNEQKHLRASMITTTKSKRRRGAFRLTVRVGAHYDRAATRRTGGAGWRMLFAERGVRAWPKGKKAPIPGRGRAWRRGLRGAVGALHPGAFMTKVAASYAAPKWEGYVMRDIESALGELKNG